MPAFLLGRLKTELFVHGLPARKDGSATSKHGLGRIRPPVASAQWSRRRSARAARPAGAFRAVSPIGALPARSCSTDPDARVALQDLLRAVPTRVLIPTNERQYLPSQAWAGKVCRATDSWSGALCRQGFLHRFHLSGPRECRRCRPRLTDPPPRSRRSLGGKQARTALPKVLWLVGRV